ncbi:MAG: TIGR04255 family protein [Bacteroidia bacterium]|nr:TIGR04255 family protein [Bacteroidia bacterium]
MSSTKLKNAPLKEVIFELHWEVHMNHGGMQTDTGFDLAQGKFAERLKTTFPLHKKLIPDGAQIKIIGAPVHQYWSGELEWPVVQHGQGMIAVNEVELGYEWEKSYKPLVNTTIDKLIESYEEPLRFNRVKLQYIDAWDLENDMEPKVFMADNLQTRIVTEYPLPGVLSGFHIQQNFELEDGSLMNLNISNGVNNQNQKRSVVWTTTVERQRFMDSVQIKDWLNIAHKATSSMFKQMLSPKFYASLDQ